MVLVSTRWSYSQPTPCQSLPLVTDKPEETLLVCTNETEVPLLCF